MKQESLSLAARNLGNSINNKLKSSKTYIEAQGKGKSQRIFKNSQKKVNPKEMITTSTSTELIGIYKYKENLRVYTEASS